MFTNSCFFFIRLIISTNLFISFLGLCLIHLSIHVHPARGQDTLETFPFSAFSESRQYQTLLNQKNIAFFEYSESQEIDDPLDDFMAYVMDPIKWDPSEPIQHQRIYRTHAGFQTHQPFLNGTGFIRLGLEARMEHAHVLTTPSSEADPITTEQHQNLADVIFAPYLNLESQPLSWIRMFGNLRLHVLMFDIQHACPTTCSSEPKGQGTHLVPSFKGGLLLGPWFNTHFFMDLGHGAYRFDEHEPVGSTAEQQINRTRFLELGFLTNPGSLIEIRGSLWGTKNNSDFFYNIEKEEFVPQGASHRYGVSLEARLELLKQTTFMGGMTVSRSTFLKTRQPNPLTPQLVGQAALHKDWNPNWSTSLQWQYIGNRTTGNQTVPAFQTVDFLVQYHLPVHDDTEDWTASLGIVNVCNHKSPFSLFHFDSGFTPNHTPALDVNYSPGQPRTVVAGISWFF